MPVRFAQAGNFSFCRIAGQVADFGDAQFGGKADFSFCQITAHIVFTGAQFQDEATFYRTSIAGDCLFLVDEQDIPVRFAATAEFSNARIGGAAEFTAARFMGPADFSHVQITGAVDFTGAFFGKEAIFVDAQFSADAGLRGGFAETINLRGTTYEHLNADWRTLFGILSPYDRQPYTQLESTFRRAGDDRAADDVYDARRRREFDDRWPPRTLQDAFWTVEDLGHRYLAGYGVRPIRFVLWALILLGLGWWVYLQPGAVTYANAEKQKALADRPLELDGLRAFLVSLEQLLPITIPGGSSFIPSDNTWLDIGRWSADFAAFATIQTVLGWVLIPAGISIVAATLRRQT
jgi:hypothetical protein